MVSISREDCTALRPRGSTCHQHTSSFLVRSAIPRECRLFRGTTNSCKGRSSDRRNSLSSTNGIVVSGKLWCRAFASPRRTPLKRKLLIRWSSFAGLSTPSCTHAIEKTPLKSFLFVPSRWQPIQPVKHHLTPSSLPSHLPFIPESTSS